MTDSIHRLGRLGRRLGGFLALGIVVAVWAVTLRPQSLGGTSFYVVVRGSSMLPTYETGDLVVVQSSIEYAVGEVVAYRVPAGEVGAGRLVIHRIVAGNANGGYIVQGDNNDSADPWRPHASDIVGRAWIAVQGLGRIMAWIHQPAIAGGLAAAIVVALMIARGSGRPATPGYRRRLDAMVRGSSRDRPGTHRHETERMF